MPAGRPIGFAVDHDVNDQLSSIDAYFAGVAAVLGHDNCGPYGGYYTCAHLKELGFGYFQQAIAWSDGHVLEEAALYQYAINLTVQDHGVDYDHAYWEDYGQWDYTAPVPVLPHHYEWFIDKTFHYKGRSFNEREIVIEYDKLMAHPRLHKSRLAELRVFIALDMERIASKASKHREPGKILTPEWQVFKRDWRYQSLAPRRKGEVVK